MTETRDYVMAVLRRSREPMEPMGFQPDWGDKPWRHKVYDDVVRVPLPKGPARTGPVSAVLGPAPAVDRGFTLDTLSDLLLNSYGLLARRLALTGNEDSHVLPWFAYAATGRGTASGGGLYPVEIYWAAGPSAPVPAGLYHYASQHHAMERLLAGDVTPQVREAVGGEADQFLLLTVKFWKNAFKYNSFSYHVVTTDIGTLLGTWNLYARSSGLPLRSSLWFAEPGLNTLLGVRTERESVFAAVPLSWDGPTPTSRNAPILGSPTVARTERERSRHVITFPQIERVHLETVHSARPTATAGTSAAATTGKTATFTLPPPDPERLDMDLGDALRARRSSFGGFSAVPPMTATELSGVLAVAAAGRRLPTDGFDPLTRLAVFVNHVEGIPSGVYDYDPDGGTLGLVESGAPGKFLQDTYFLDNYNLEQAAAVLAVVGRPEAVLDELGDRGYRVLNAEVGAAAQATYIGAVAAGVGCGAIFGFDNVAIRERLCGTDTDEWPLLLILLGHERRGVPEFDSPLV
jgi:SagB-type dehydrogenase family enzyme